MGEILRVQFCAIWASCISNNEFIQEYQHTGVTVYSSPSVPLSVRLPATTQQIRTSINTDVYVPSAADGWWSLPYWRNSRNVRSLRETDTSWPSLGSACRLAGSYWLLSDGRWGSQAASSLSIHRSDLDWVWTARRKHTARQKNNFIRVPETGCHIK